MDAEWQTGCSLQVSINKCLRRIANIHWLDKNSQQRVWKETVQETVLEQLKEENGTGLNAGWEEMMTSLTNTQYNGHCKATQEKRSGEKCVDTRTDFSCFMFIDKKKRVKQKSPWALH